MPVDATAAWAPPSIVLAAGLFARIAGTLVGGAAALPGVDGRIRLALAAAIAAGVFPMALALQRFEPAAPGAVGMADAILVTAGESALGIAIGAALASVVSAGAWAGGILGSVAGLSWADDFDPEGDAQSAGIARLAWWISGGVFLAAGGLGAVVAAVIDSVRMLPVGAVLPVAGIPRPDLSRLAADLPAEAFLLALTLVVPTLLAVAAFHLVSAIALRTVPFAPGAGFLQALAALVMLGAIHLGADAWMHGFPILAQGPIERLFGAR